MLPLPVPCLCCMWLALPWEGLQGFKNLFPAEIRSWTAPWEGAAACRALLWGWWLSSVGWHAMTPLFPLFPQLSLKCRAPEVSQYIYQAYETILKN